MCDTELYRQILGPTDPWYVERIDLNMPEKQVHVFVDHKPGVAWPGPTCGRELACFDHAFERVWRHLDTCQLKSLLHARVPRVDRPEDSFLQARVPWAQPCSRFTLLMERIINDVIGACSTIAGACVVMRTSWEEAFGVMERAVERGLACKRERVIPHLGVDEKVFRKGHSYTTVLCALDRMTVEHVADDRRIESFAGYFQGLTATQREGVEAVAMNMWEPYMQATLRSLPLAVDKIVFDRFHVLKHMNEAVDKVRRGEHRDLMARGDETLKETLGHLWTYSSEGWARRFFKDWYGWARRSALEPVKNVALMIKSRLDHIVSYHCNPVTNGVAEGLNSKIMTIKRKACGFRNRQNFKTAILFHYDGLELYPC